MEVDDHLLAAARYFNCYSEVHSHWIDRYYLSIFTSI